MRKKRLHDPAEASTSVSSPTTSTTSATATGPADDAAPGAAGPRSHAARGRRGRVRNRLLAGVLLTGLAVLAAGAPAVLSAYQRMDQDQRQLDEAELGQRALALSHTLADERDGLLAAGPEPAATEHVLTPEHLDRVERQVAGLLPDAPEAVRTGLDSLPGLRERAASEESDAAELHTAYTRIIEDLGDLFLAGSHARHGEAANATASALPDLARAADASSAVRGLVLAALRGEGEQPGLTGTAQHQAAREAAALADFDATAEAAARDAYARDVAGPEVTAAEDYLDQLTDQPVLSAEDRELDAAAVADALATRTEAQRSVLVELSTDHLAALKAQRGDDLLSLQLRVLLVLAALVLALGISVRTARSLTRPLAAVRLGSRRVAADPAGQQPVRYTGRNDEFAEVVNSVNSLHARAVELHRRAAETARDSGGLRAERDRLLAEQRQLSSRLTALHGAVHGMFAHHAQRLLSLVSEQLSVLEGLEEHETDPDHLAVLFTLDHLAARMRRHGENLLLLAGAGPAGRLGEPLPLIDVLRAAVSEIERYELVEISPPPQVRVIGPTVRDLSHLLAELLDNATAFSPEGARVRLTGRWLEGGLTLLVEDEGMGLSDERLVELNARLADPVTPPPGADGALPHAQGASAGIGMGLYTVARLAARHRLGCWLRRRPGGGTLAEVVLPTSLLTDLGETQGVAVLSELAGLTTATGATAVPGAGGARRGTHGIGMPGQDGGPAVAGVSDVTGVTGGTSIAGVSGVSELSGAAGMPGAVGATGGHPVVAPYAGATPAHGVPIPHPAQGGGPGPEHARADDSAPHGHARTESGLPLRTAGAQLGSGGHGDDPAAAGTPARGVDAEELRRRLGGFQRGAREGHRDAARATDSGTGQEAPS
ncbi:nitrate- and nitrite sensing domain-containing protein [Streptomyces sp. B6B3]|uniref:nitrate- and nitrite sensing domain-containing protein n=1 Tax=Streptomyces sp. B6B3 TaxID=3153570 RepID=UPI00325D15CE